MKTGIVVFAHGSSVASANEAVRSVAARMAEAGGFELVETAFLELARPDLNEAVGRLRARGAGRIVVVPYFLTLGIHLQRDLPVRIEELRRRLTTRMNLEAALTPEMIAIAQRVRPDDVCFVPERRAELTTEGGLDVAANLERVAHACRALGEKGIRVSLFIDPDPRQVEAAKRAGLSRKVIIRKLAHPVTLVHRPWAKRRRICDAAVAAALIELWKLFDCPCGQPPAPLLRE
ncbi:MAG: pyridoxine 5'-phosphate synthase [Chloroflexi bacterium]|nr:pyridoxine 5'-phosphate synthase [Chloroflexota bacterium]